MVFPRQYPDGLSDQVSERGVEKGPPPKEFNENGDLWFPGNPKPESPVIQIFIDF
jgi:hypothetical protein